MRKKPGARPVPVLTSEQRALIEAHLRKHPPRAKTAVEPRKARPKSLATLARRGEVPVDFTLDLHGRTLEQSLRAVDEMLRRGQGAGWAFVRVVTGKGRHSEDGRAVLADEIPLRLRLDPRVAEVVRAVRAIDGGTGAWFVRLRA